MAPPTGTPSSAPVGAVDAEGRRPLRGRSTQTHRRRAREGCGNSSKTSSASTTCTRPPTAVGQHLNNALKAKELFSRDKDYIVRNGEVLIVDEFTGRVLIGQPLQREGMHQAIEAKGARRENQTLATITPELLPLYDSSPA